MKIKINELSSNNKQIGNVQSFLFHNIKEEYGYGYVPKFHYDIINLKDTYVVNKQNNFYIATNELGKIIGCIGIRGYDKDFKEFKNIYFKDTAASIWRLMIDPQYRRIGIGTKLVNYVENFSKSKDYQNIYLHTQKNLPGALKFWQAQNYSITHNIQNEHMTIHMIKYL